MLQRNVEISRKEIFSRYVTEDETWIPFFNPDTKVQSNVWVSKCNHPPVKAKTFPGSKKVMISVFWDAQGIVFIDYLEKW